MASVDDSSSPRGVYCQAYFVTIATILGTGILGLPVTLSRAGLYPFLLSFLLDAVMQSLLIHFFVDLLQRTCVLQLHKQRIKDESQILTKQNGDSFDDTGDDDDDADMKQGKEPMPLVQEDRLSPSPNLHLLGCLFLEFGLRQMFDMLIIFQFISLLVCYALAGSEAYAQFLGIDHYYVIPAFVWVLTLVIVFSMHLIQPVISVLTIVKGSVLLATIAVTYYVGVTQGRSSHSDFSHIGAPFLMGTVALGGTINTMPFTFEKIKFKKEEVESYRLAVQLGLWTCVLLNIMCAKLNGEISTLPMTKILQRDYPNFAWVAVLVQVFIMVSITVSYLTIGGALHHTLTGVVYTVLVTQHPYHDHPNETFTCRCKLVSTLMSLLAFIAVFAVAMADPTGFVDILEKFASLTMNSQAGIFVFLMLLASRKTALQDIPLPMDPGLQRLVWVIPVFFNAAVVMDVYDTINDVLMPKQLLPVVLNDSDGAGPGNIVRIRRQQL